MTERSLAYVPIDELVPAPSNPKGHRLDLLQQSMTRFSYTEPALVDDRTGRMVAGHGRVETLAAAKAAGLPAPDGVRVEDGRWLVPVVTGWASKDDAEANAYLVASNRLAEVGGWDDAGLAALLEQVNATPLGLEGIGYTNDDLAELLVHVGAYDRQPPGDVDPDDVPEPPAEPVTQRGGYGSADLTG